MTSMPKISQTWWLRVLPTVYLSARITDPQREGTELAEHMRTNPLLRDLMSNFLTDRQTELDFDELGVAEVVDLLDRANIDAVLRDFGDRNPREDP